VQWGAWSIRRPFVICGPISFQREQGSAAVEATDGAHIVNAHQNRDLAGLVATAETGKPACDDFDAAFGDPIAFFTALQIVARENGFSRKSDPQGFYCAKTETAPSHRYQQA
jgi:hypothetical protein